MKYPITAKYRETKSWRDAFTLVEMIIVISIISVLLGLLYGALERAQKFSRRTITYSEIKTIEAAFKQYYAHYHSWPSNQIASTRLVSDEDHGFIIDERISKLLQGHATSLAEDIEFNPEMIPFLELARYAPQSYVPVNPFKSNVKGPADTTRAYRVLFDTNGDRQITLPPSGDPNQNLIDMPSTNIIADVVVWTLIPSSRRVDATGRPIATTQTETVIGSWHSFSADN